jgi:hypothetical protein
MSSGTQRLASVATKGIFAIPAELGVQPRRRLTVAHADTVTASGFAQKMIALVSGQHVSGSTVPGTDRQRASKC